MRMPLIFLLFLCLHLPAISEIKNSPKGVLLNHKDKDLGYTYKWVGDNPRMEICVNKICNEIINPPKLHQLIVDDSEKYVIGLSYLANGDQIYIWNSSFNLIEKRKITCHDVPTCCVVNHGKHILWFSSMYSPRATSKDGKISIYIPEFNDSDCRDEIPNEFKIDVNLVF